jgi:hypothetical protein
MPQKWNRATILWTIMGERLSNYRDPASVSALGAFVRDFKTFWLRIPNYGLLEQRGCQPNNMFHLCLAALSRLNSEQIFRNDFVQY